MAWETPVTDWVNGDIVGEDDLNRIEGNLLELYERRAHVVAFAETTTTTGYYTVTHGAGFTPATVIVNSGTLGGADYWTPVGTDSFGATTFRGRAAGATGEPLTAATDLVGQAVCFPTYSL